MAQLASCGKRDCGELDALFLFYPCLMVGWRVSPPLETHKNTPTIGFAEYSDWNRNLPRNGILETGSLKGSDLPDFE